MIRFALLASAVSLVLCAGCGKSPVATDGDGGPGDAGTNGAMDAGASDAGEDAGASDDAGAGDDAGSDFDGGADAGPGYPIKHIIVIVKENHTFDNYFGTFPGAEGTTTYQLSDGGIGA